MKFQNVACQITVLQASVVKRQADDSFTLETTESSLFLDAFTTEGFEFPAITTEGPLQLMTTQEIPITDVFTFPVETTQGPPPFFSTPEPYQSTYPLAVDYPTSTDGLPFVTTDSDLVFPDLATTENFLEDLLSTATTPLFDFEDFKTSPRPFVELTTAPDWIFQTTASEFISNLATLPAKLLQNSTKTSTSTTTPGTTAETTVTTETIKPTQTTSTASVSMSTSSVVVSDTNKPAVDQNAEGIKPSENEVSDSLETSTTPTSVSNTSTKTTTIETSTTPGSITTTVSDTQTTTETSNESTTKDELETTSIDPATNQANTTSSPPVTETTAPASSSIVELSLFLLASLFLI